MMMPGDSDAVKGKRLQRSSLRRAWHFAHPYRRTIALFLGAIVLAALVGLVPPFAFRTILDDAIPDRDRNLITIVSWNRCGSWLTTPMASRSECWVRSRTSWPSTSRAPPVTS